MDGLGWEGGREGGYTCWMRLRKVDSLRESVCVLRHAGTGVPPARLAARLGMLDRVWGGGGCVRHVEPDSDGGGVLLGLKRTGEDQIMAVTPRVYAATAALAT